MPGGTHPAVVVSNSARCGRKPEVVILACRTMRPETFREAAENEMLLDESDGLDWKTLRRCDLLFTVAKARFTRRRGTVGVERWREIGRRIVQGLAISGL